MKTELHKIYFEFRDNDILHTIVYIYVGMLPQFFRDNGSLRKTYSVTYLRNGKLVLTCDETQVSPCITDAKEMLKDCFKFLENAPKL